MPFVTEELWQRLPRGEAAPRSIMVSAYPAPCAAWRDTAAEAAMELIEESVHAVRSLRSAYNLPPSARPEVFFLAAEGAAADGAADTLAEQAWIVAALA
eukprot:2894294-Ditylum_brightwellii.AAC.1